MSVEDIASQSSVIFWAWLKRPIFEVHDSQGGERRDNKLPFNNFFFQQYICQNLLKSVDVHWSYIVHSV